MSNPSPEQTHDRSRYDSQPRQQSSLSGLTLRLLIAGAIILFSVVTFYSQGQINPITGEEQRVDMSVKFEVELGKQMVGEMGPQSLNRQANAHVDQIGYELVEALERRLAKRDIAIPYPFEFHLLADRRSANAFALPGGQILITEALYRALSTDGQNAHNGRLAGILGHEIGHVIVRHGPEHLTTSALLRGNTETAGLAGGSPNNLRLAFNVADLVELKYGRNDELAAHDWGVELMILAGYDPKHMTAVTDVLKRSAGGRKPPEFLSTHPRPDAQGNYIQDIISRKFPSGVPVGLR